MAEPIKPDESKTPNDSNKQGNGGQGDENTPKTLTQEEHQAELDRIAAKTREEERKKLEKSFSDKIAEERKKWEDEAKLSESEKEKKRKAEEDAARAEKDKNITLRENRADVRDKFAELFPGIKPEDETIDMLNSLDKDLAVKNVESLKKIVDTVAQQLVENKLKGDSKKDPNTQDNNKGTVSFKRVL